MTPHQSPKHGRANRRMLLFSLFFWPLFVCGATVLFYLVFPPARLNLLVMGVDSRGSEGYVARTDSLMLVGSNPSQLRLSLLGLSRELFIEVPGYGTQQINVVNVLGEQDAEGNGPRLLAASIEADFGIQVDRYLRLDFDAFVALVDAVGGVTVDVERRIVDDLYPDGAGGYQVVTFEPGVQELNGERALMYARTRHTDDDYARAARQQQIISGLLTRLRNPLRWPGAWLAFNQHVDTNLTLGDMLALGPTAILNIGRYERLVINRDYIVGTAAGHPMPDYEKITPWLAGRFVD
ncbi:MAG TPA: LCP family protein [Aggregatilineales bacterium]|nr:LCP family protein [Aggregatilineales bacterium]